jgi:hypothetical protein
MLERTKYFNDFETQEKHFLVLILKMCFATICRQIKTNYFLPKKQKIKEKWTKIKYIMMVLIQI